MEPLREIATETMRFRILDNGIIEGRPIPGWKGTGTLEHAKNDMKALGILSNGKLYPTLNYLPDLAISKEARDYYSNHPPLAIAAALIVKSGIQRILGNFFLGMNKVKVPIRLFTNEQEAVEWLLQMKAEKESDKP
jgi:hypothetical protein